MDYSSGRVSFIVWLIYVLVFLFYLYCTWKIFVKAGKPGWASIIPIYNLLVELEIVGRPWYWLLLMFIPVVGIVLEIIVVFRMAKVFGHSTAFGFGLLFLSFIFIPILAFDSSTYLGATVE